MQMIDPILAILMTKGLTNKSFLIEKFGGESFREVIEIGAAYCDFFGFTSITNSGRERFNSGGKRLVRQMPKPEVYKKPEVAQPRARLATPKPVVIESVVVEPIRKTTQNRKPKIDPRLCKKNYTRTFDLAKVNQMIQELEGKDPEAQAAGIQLLAKAWGMKPRLVRDKAYRIDLLDVQKVKLWNEPLEVRLLVRMHKAKASQSQISKALADKGWSRSRSMIYRKLQSLGLVQPRSPEWTKQETDLLRANAGVLTAIQMSKQIKREPNAIKEKSLRMGLIRTGAKNAKG